MIRSYHVLSSVLLVILMLNGYSYSQTTNLSGTINTVATPVTVYNNSSSIDVQSTTGFNMNDTVLIIQMKGATIDETNSGAFGDIVNIGDAGNYELSTICNISGQTINFQSPLGNTYSPTGGFTQLIKVDSYHSVNVTGSLTAPAWDAATGTGGVLILMASNAVTLNADITMDGKGFRGGWSQPDYSACSCTCSPGDPEYMDYFFTSGTCRAAGKGEGIADSIPGKEFGRGKQANGGGGGNDHNAGGAGGANYGAGGIGGTASAPSCFFGPYCRGNYPGEASVDLSTYYNSSDKLFLGGGGGAGHANNLAGMDGKAGGGIIIILADTINGQGYSISSVGLDATTYNDGDGQGGGGAGGSVALNVNAITGSMSVDVSGGQGGSVDSYSASNCKGPGGGGGGGVVRTSISLPGGVTTDLTGGNSGIQTGTNCTGQTNGAIAGTNGNILTGYTLGIGGSSGATTIDTQVACDSYTWIDGNTYTSNNNSATWTLTNSAGCDSIVQLDLTINNSVNGIDIVTTCGNYTWIDGNNYTSSTNTPTYTYTGGAVNGCDSVVTLDLTITTFASGTDIQTACDSYTWIDGNTYTSSTNTPTYTYVGGAANGCDSVVSLDLLVNYSTTGTDVISACDSYLWIDGNTYTTSNNSATWTLTGAGGCDSVVTLNLTINNATSATDVISACDSYTWIDGNTYTSSNNTATWTITNSAGCDSVITLDLTINTSPVNVVTQNGITLTALQSGATYQWLDCNNGYSPLNGETNQQFTASANGNYAVEVTMNGCADTSSCYVINNIGISELYKDVLSIHPNPATDILNIDGIDQVVGFKYVEITSVDGKVVLIRKEGSSELNVATLSNGVYLLNIVHENGKETVRFVKQ